MNQNTWSASKTPWGSAACFVLVFLGGCDREEVEFTEQAAQAQLEGIHDAQMELEGTQGMVNTLEGAGSLPAGDDGPPRPEGEADDFVPGAVYGLHPQMCHNHGGSPGTDPDGEPYCNLGDASTTSSTTLATKAI